MNKNDLKNEAIKNHSFLDEMYADSYFPDFLVDKVQEVLVELCYNIEQKSPKSLEELYELTHYSTEKINDLQDDFDDNDSEIETAARDAIGTAFDFIATAYGFEADTEELIAPREW